MKNMQGSEFNSGMQKIETKLGVMSVPAFTHDKAPGLAVTCNMELKFSVTHLSSGFSVVGNYELAGDALLIMGKMQCIANELGFTWDCSADELRKSTAKIKTKTFKEAGSGREVTFQEWIHIQKMIDDDFMIYDADHPMSLAIDLFRELGDAPSAGVV